MPRHEAGKAPCRGVTPIPRNFRCPRKDFTHTSARALYSPRRRHPCAR
nr:MAG: hypothetical protein [Molluscum contagiosum virus]